ncbi:NAD(P)/FAD-dependent oxidoreductase [Tetragenococcus solitarius]|uniref:FAD-dependent oxidoreductase n=1 Tax=Tetragenococcus solitarius TaxID=71453 RepID=A0ABN3Y3D1_9ENTE|nr:FAD-dependent oxidoreductase [Tetragenococcus solitarius]
MSSLENNNSYEYVIVGGGMVAGYAINGIREKDTGGDVLVVSKDADVPYERPALSKKLWLDDEFTEENIKVGAEKQPNVSFKFNTTVNKIDRQSKTIQLGDDTVVHYNKLLLATGGEPTTIDGPDDPHVIVFRDWADYRKLRQFSGNHKHVIVVGGGYIGSELAAALIQNDTKVTMIYPEKVLGENQFPEAITSEYEDTFRKAGVNLVNGKKAESYQREKDQLVVTLDDGSQIKGDTLVIGLGVTPRLTLAKASGLELAEDGIEVDEYLQTSDPSIWSAGDIAYYPDKILGRQRIEHVDHARNSGQQVGRNMAGAHEPYTHTPYFYSNIFSISWQAIGSIHPSLPQIFDKREEGTIVYFLKDQQLVGVLVWNVNVNLDDVRNLLANPPANTDELVGSIKENK